RWLPLVAIGLMLGGAMLAAVYSDPVIPTVPPPEFDVTRSTGPEPTDTPTPLGAPSPDRFTPVDLPAWLSTAISAICISAALAVVLLLVWLTVRDRWRRRQAQLVLARRGGLPALSEARRLVRGAIDEGLADLDDADADPRRAIIACWVRLERAAEVA